jgi:asparagine synthase (glutamine-hydrolysing)
VNRSADAQARVQAMTALLTHRGPDAEGFLTNDPRAPGFALGMRRLSIIDLPGGGQPIWNESRDVAVVFNGELYNYRELRATLERAHHRFATASDTEVLVHAWEQWGEDCLSELRGMFAFAVADFRKHYTSGPVLFLARDPLGMKPLYYAQTAAGFAFASELRALAASGIVQRRLSPDALTSYLLFGSVCEPVTPFEEIFSLPPGHRILLYLPDRRRTPRTHPWWDPRRSAAARRTRQPATLTQAASELRPMLADAVRSHLIADVPVGLFLSSGLDSGCIATLAAREHRGIQSFTLTFPGTPYDESELTRLTAHYCGTRHDEVPLSGSDVVSRVDQALAVLDQPTMDGMNTYFVSWAARQVGLKVALSGLGGDELFGGYATFRQVPSLEMLAGFAKCLPQFARTASLPAIRALLNHFMAPDATAKAAAAWQSPDSLPHAYFFARALFPPGELARLIHPRFRPSHVAADGTTLEPTWLGWLQHVADDARRMTGRAAVSWLELRTYMLNTLLRDTDCVSMAHSLEVRVPLLDTPLVEFVGALPESARFNTSQPKALLLAAIGDALPPEILANKKRTFTLPWKDWMGGPLRARIEESFANPAPALGPHMHWNGVLDVWKSFLASDTSWSRPWSLFVLNEWCRRLS